MLSAPSTALLTKKHNLRNDFSAMTPVRNDLFI